MRLRPASTLATAGDRLSYQICRNGMLAEYWANADSLMFFQQLGVRAVPAG